MDPLSITASIAGLILFATKVTSETRTLFSAWNDAPSDTKAMLRNFSIFISTLTDLKALLSSSNGVDSPFAKDEEQKFLPVIDECEDTFIAVKKLMRGYRWIGTSKRERLRWVAEGQKECEVLARTIEGHKTILLLKLAIAKSAKVVPTSGGKDVTLEMMKMSRDLTDIRALLLQVLSERQATNAGNVAVEEWLDSASTFAEELVPADIEVERRDGNLDTIDIGAERPADAGSGNGRKDVGRDKDRRKRDVGKPEEEDTDAEDKLQSIPSTDLETDAQFRGLFQTIRRPLGPKNSRILQEPSQTNQVKPPPNVVYSEWLSTCYDTIKDYRRIKISPASSASALWKSSRFKVFCDGKSFWEEANRFGNCKENYRRLSRDKKDQVEAAIKKYGEEGSFWGCEMVAKMVQLRERQNHILLYLLAEPTRSKAQIWDSIRGGIEAGTFCRMIFHTGRCADGERRTYSYQWMNGSWQVSAWFDPEPLSITDPDQRHVNLP